MSGNAYLNEAGEWVPVEEDPNELVPDPFVPGQRIRRSLADVHPSERFARAVERHYAAKAKETEKR
jgi:hypothetical protein